MIAAIFVADQKNKTGDAIISRAAHIFIHNARMRLTESKGKGEGKNEWKKGDCDGKERMPGAQMGEVNPSFSP